MSALGRATISDAKEALRGIRGGWVLDVATGRGGFVHDLVAGLDSYDEIVGIDVDAAVRTAFEEALSGNRNVRFRGDGRAEPHVPARIVRHRDDVGLAAPL
jgi:hypothetical protein